MPKNDEIQSYEEIVLQLLSVAGQGGMM